MKYRHPGAPISRQVCGHLFFLLLLRLPISPPASAVSSDKSLSGCICLLSHPRPHPSASPPPSPRLFHLFTPPPSPCWGVSRRTVRQIELGGCSVADSAVFLWNDPNFPDSLVSSTVSSSHAHVSVLLISDFLLSALSTYAANLRADFGVIFLRRLQSPLFYLITAKLGWHVGRDKGVFSLPLLPRWQLDLIENCLQSHPQMSSEDRAQTVANELMAPAACVPNCFDSPRVPCLFCHKRASFITVTWKTPTKWINICIHYSHDATQDGRRKAKPKISWKVSKWSWHIPKWTILAVT